MIRDIVKAVEPITHRVKHMVARAYLHQTDDQPVTQEMQVEISRGEVRDKVDRLQNYGFTSVPLEGAEAIVLSIGGDRGHPVVVVCDDERYRHKELQAGEVAIYHHQGDLIELLNDNVIHIKTAKKVFIESDDVVHVKSKNDVVVKSTDGKIYLEAETHIVGNLIVHGTVTSGVPPDEDPEI